MTKQGFCDSLEKVAAEVRACTRCRLFETATHGVPGEGLPDARIFIAGQAPGKQEDLVGRPFVGRAGRFLNTVLWEIGIRREDVYVSGTVKHFPPRNRLPRKDEIEACRGYILREITLVDPEIVVLMGNTAITLINEPHLSGRTVLTTVHPSAAMRFPKMAARLRADLQRLSQLITQTDLKQEKGLAD